MEKQELTALVAIDLSAEYSLLKKVSLFIQLKFLLITAHGEESITRVQKRKP